MSYFDPNDYEGLEEKKRAIPVSQIKAWEDAQKENQALKAQLSEVQRNQVFAEAGIPSEGPGQWFRKGYDGELNVEAVRTAYGSPASQPAPDMTGHQAASQMAAGAVAATPSGTAAELAALKAEARSMKNGLGFDAQRAKLNTLMAKEGVEADFNKWKLPGQLNQ